MNSTVQLECSAFALTGGKTRIPVSWSKAGGELPYGRTRDNRQGLLIITEGTRHQSLSGHPWLYNGFTVASEVRSSDTGVYICAAVDTNGRAVTDNVTLTVSLSPLPALPPPPAPCCRQAPFLPPYKPLHNLGLLCWDSNAFSKP
ncbi:hypothetical protein GWK47_029999 [Chionoecetes opilio]|uniref:Ig-like domain-containing protein n=1 Tax=Chionoecetes opilio TaxID=41210 RepID=A0A8J4YW22_CHIOP|nr:hypothetical protein GWK47_029999 [Chionoecetes opilio]